MNKKSHTRNGQQYRKITNFINEINNKLNNMYDQLLVVNIF